MAEEAYDRGAEKDIKELLDRRPLFEEEAVKPKIDEELIRLQTELSTALFGMNPGMAKKVIAAANEEIVRLDHIRIKSEEGFKSASVHMVAGRFSIAADIFDRVAALKKEIGDEEGEALVWEKSAECVAKINKPDAAILRVKSAFAIYQKIGNKEGVKRTEALIQEIEQKEKEGTG